MLLIYDPPLRCIDSLRSSPQPRAEQAQASRRSSASRLRNKLLESTPQLTLRKQVCYKSITPRLSAGIDKKMKAAPIVCLLVFVFCSLTAGDVTEMGRPAQLKKLAEWREARTEEAMLDLISFAKNEEIPMSMRAVAALDLNQGYLPVDEMNEWAGKSLLEEEDLVEFVVASSDQDHKRWLEFIETSVSERRTNLYQLKIYQNEVQRIHGTGLKRMGEDERLSLMQSRLNEISPKAKFDRVEYETVMGGFLMIAYGYYMDESGDERLIALLDSERYRKDQKIDPDAGINSVTSLRDSTP